MRSSVIIKGNKYGFQIVLNPAIPFEELVAETAAKFCELAQFFNGQKSFAVSFEGRILTKEEQNRLVDVIAENSGLNISYLIDGAKAYETQFAKALAEAGAFRGGSGEVKNSIREEGEAPDWLKESDDGQFYRGSLRFGQTLEVKGSIVVIGDICPGAKIIAGGNIVIVGSAKGEICAGFPDDEDAYIAGLFLDPDKIQIGRHQIKYAGLKKKSKNSLSHFRGATMAFVENESIYMKTITKSLIHEVSIS